MPPLPKLRRIRRGDWGDISQVHVARSQSTCGDLQKGNIHFAFSNIRSEALNGITPPY